MISMHLSWLIDAILMQRKVIRRMRAMMETQYFNLIMGCTCEMESNESMKRDTSP